MHQKLSIFVINMKKDKDRKASIIEKLNKECLPFEFIDGIDVSSLNENELNEIFSKDKAINDRGRKLSKGEIGCSMSHLSAYQKIVEENIEQAIIFEDNMNINCDNLSNTLVLLQKTISNSSPKIHLLTPVTSYLSRKVKRINDTYNIAQVVQALSAKGYLINQLAAKKILSTNKKVWLVADDWVKFRMHSSVKIFCVIPSVISIDSNFHSSVGNDRYSQLKNKNFKYVSSRLKNTIIANIKKYFWYIPFKGYVRN